MKKKTIKSLRKKASLSLSINAIVVLVLALIMLGLGVAFTKGTFSKFKTITVPESPVEATRNDPIQVPNEIINGEVNKNLVFTLSIFNTATDNSHNYIDPIISCKKIGQNGQQTPGLNPITTSQIVNPGTYANFKYIIPHQDKKESDNCLIYVYACPEPSESTLHCDLTNRELLGSKQIVINIQ